EAGSAIGGALFEENVVYDNWSVNVYIDNQANAVIRNNLIFDHPADLNDLLYTGDTYWTEDVGRKLVPVGVMLGDEEWQSDATNHYANLDGTKVYDNVIANCRVAVRDYAEGPNAIAWHGLKNTTIANNTILLPAYASPDYAAGIEVLDNKTPSGTERNVNSVIANNVVYGFGNGLVAISRQASALAGVAFDRNIYFGAASASFGYGSPVTTTNFAGWKGQFPGLDAQSLWQDPQLVDVTRFGASAAAVPVYDWTFAALTATSPAKDMGLSLAPLFTNDFALLLRPQGMAWDAGALEFLPCATGDVGAPTVTAPAAVAVTQTLCP
ncbi:MAG TPA: hypothetical protein VGR00_04760, partial [Thermoanaerobaculia bacterium]|nr:hypothetical protein [Thermoanaerobaculia bacterium]